MKKAHRDRDQSVRGHSTLTKAEQFSPVAWSVATMRTVLVDGKNETVQASHLGKLARHCTNAWIRTRNLRFWRPLLCQLSYVDLCLPRDSGLRRLLTPNVKLTNGGVPKVAARNCRCWLA